MNSPIPEQMTDLLRREGQLFHQYSGVGREKPGDTLETVYDRKKEHLIEMIGVQLLIRNFFRDNQDYRICEFNYAVHKVGEKCDCN